MTLDLRYWQEFVHGRPEVDLFPYADERGERALFGEVDGTEDAYIDASAWDVCEVVQ